MSQEIAAVGALSSMNLLSTDALEQIPAVKTIYDRISPAMPPNLTSTEVSTSLDKEVKHFNFDEGHAGRFSVPDTSGGSIAFWDIFSLPNPPSYIATHLSFPPKTNTPVDEDNVLLFIPGLNTMHQLTPGGTSTVERLIHYANILNVPLSQIHLGTSLDQGDIVLSPEESAQLIPLLPSIDNQLPPSAKPNINDGIVSWNILQIDHLSVILSYPNFVDTPIKASIRGLLESTKSPTAKPVSILAYSRGAVELEAALREFVRVNPGEETTTRLREKLTILTIGSGSDRYPDGPAYVHLSSNQDPLTRGRGVYQDKLEGGGADAVYLHCDSPFQPQAFDNHNFGSVTAQFLSLVLAANGVKSIRAIWEKGQNGELVIPDGVDEAIKAMVTITKAKDWLWDPENALKGLADDAFPDLNEAKSILKDVMGEEYLNTILTNFKGV